jgi:hypothetical protein
MGLLAQSFTPHLGSSSAVRQVDRGLDLPNLGNLHGICVESRM